MHILSILINLDIEGLLLAHLIHNKRDNGFEDARKNHLGHPDLSARTRPVGVAAVFILHFLGIIPRNGWMRLRGADISN